MFTVLRCYSPKWFVSYKLWTAVLLKCLKYSFILSAPLWMGAGISSAPLRDKREHGSLRASQREILGGLKVGKWVLSSLL